MADNLQRNRLLLGVFLLSAGLLAFEVFLVRVVSILLYPVATYLVISLALLGFGASGTALSLRRAPQAPPVSLAMWAAAAFGAAVPLALGGAWLAARHVAIALSLPFVFGLPFALGGLAIATALSRPQTAVHQVYFADLMGAGVGAGLVLLGLRYLTGVQVASLIAALGLLAAAAIAPRRRQRAAIGLAAGGLVLGGWLAPLPYGIVPLAPKELALFTSLGPQVNWEYQGWSPLARVDVVSLPGDRITLPEALEYKLVTQDGGAPTLLLSIPDVQAADFADHSILGVPYWIKRQPKVFIIGLGGGPDVQAALHFGARAITGVEINPQMIALVNGPFADFTGHPYDDERVTVIQGDGRHVIRLSVERYDIVQLTGVDTTVASPGANPNLAENYLYTVEAFREYFHHLTPDGVISISFPDVEGLSLRLVATAWEALRAEGVAEPETHIVVSRSGGFTHILVKRSSLTPAELETLRARFAQPLWGVYFPLYHRLFGTSFDPGDEILYAADPDQAGPHAELMAALADGRGAEWMEAQTRDIRPPTDDRPFVFVLDRWGSYAPNQETLALALVILGAATLVFLFAPLLAHHRRGLTLAGAPWLALYFLALGLGFIAVEVNLIQKFTLLLGHPSYALATTLCTLLVASGLGSLVSGRWRVGEERAVAWAVAGVATLVVAGAFGLTPLMNVLIGWPLMARWLVAVILTALPGFCMGIPFPAGLRAVKRQAPAFVPWAWALNSSGTVIGTLAALLTAMAYGFGTVFVLAALLYLLAGGAFGMYARRRVGAGARHDSDRGPAGAPPA